MYKYINYVNYYAICSFEGLNLSINLINFSIFTGFVLNCAVFGTLFRPLEPVKVAVERPDANGIDGDDHKKSSAEQLPLLLRIKMARDDQMRKSESLASFADNSSIHADAKLGPKSRFLKNSNNNMYPTAAQIITRSTTALSSSRRHSSHSLNLQTNINFGSNVPINETSPTKSQKRLSVPSYHESVPQEEDGKAVIVSSVPEDVSMKKVATFTELLKPVQEERRGSDEDAEMLANGDRAAVIQEAKKGAKRNRTTSECSSRSREVGVRPFYRDDIFFSASLHRLPQYTSQVCHAKTLVLHVSRKVSKIYANGVFVVIQESVSSRILKNIYTLPEKMQHPQGQVHCIANLCDR